MGTITYPPLQEVEEKFWRQVKPENENNCWLWQGHCCPRGYGRLEYRRRGQRRFILRAHRVSLAVANGIWPSSEQYVCHTCDVPQCVNPKHLYLGDALSNMRDAVSRGRLETSARRAGFAMQQALNSEQALQVLQWAKEEKDKRKTSKPSCGCKWTQAKLRETFQCAENTVTRAIARSVDESRESTRSRNDAIRELYFGPDGHDACRKRGIYTGAKTHRWMAEHFNVHISTITDIIYGVRHRDLPR